VTVQRAILIGTALAGAGVTLWLLYRHDDEAPRAARERAPVTAPEPEPQRQAPGPAEPPPPPPAAAAPTPAPDPARPEAAPAPPQVAASNRPDDAVPMRGARSLHQALATTSPEEARLAADLARSGRPFPPQAHTLVEMKTAGASAADLSNYVRSSFPPDMITRVLALKWIRINVPGPIPPATDGMPQARTRMGTNPAPEPAVGQPEP
jgi:type IV secretory pathway VirB10-like protein